MEDLFIANYNNVDITVTEGDLQEGKEIKLLKKLKRFNLGSGHEKIETSKIDEDEYVFTGITYFGGPVQRMYFKRIK